MSDLSCKSQFDKAEPWRYVDIEILCPEVSVAVSGGALAILKPWTPQMW